ncbi:hypothetical protein GCM10023178_04520 [Actinomadura luteofluorescens]
MAKKTSSPRHADAGVVASLGQPGGHLLPGRVQRHETGRIRRKFLQGKADGRGVFPVRSVGCGGSSGSLLSPTATTAPPTSVKELLTGSGAGGVARMVQPDAVAGG